MSELPRGNDFNKENEKCKEQGHWLRAASVLNDGNIRRRPFGLVLTPI